MKTILFLASSLDGQIARSDDSVTWSDDVWRNYFEFCSTVGVLLVGRRTYELMAASDELKKLKLRAFGVVSRTLKALPSDVLVFETHRAALTHFERARFHQIVIGGGRELAHSLLADDLLDEIQLDIEPKLYGTGISMFKDLPAER